MFVQALRLNHFRLFTDQVFHFDQPVAVVLGSNAAGKSSLVEAIDLLATGQSFRAGRVEEMIQFDQEIGRVKAKVSSQLGVDDKLADLDQVELEITLTNGEVRGKKTHKQLYAVNQNKRRKKDFVGKLLTVVFRPEDLRLIEGSPSRRRDYLDKPMSFVSQQYSLSLGKYNKALRRRNKLLSQIREGEQPETALKFWDMSILKHGQILQDQRKKYCQFMNQSVESPLPMKIEYQPSLITPDRLEQYRRREVAAGYTLIGPHKDEIDVQLDLDDYRSLASFGSRGQKRLGVLWLKRAEFQFLEEQTERTPVLLLDDILSELDQDSRKLVVGLVGSEQLIITTTQPELVKELEQLVGQVQLIELGS
ncbi:MAG: DNA replication and repair protein RecF [Candidatus Pacebacteria bacterium]|nr:DNA replication and repair protein RecF [Candidatus Paceibacterota bacterium]